jgi:hypothetical protein
VLEKRPNCDRSGRPGEFKQVVFISIFIPGMIVLDHLRDRSDLRCDSKNLRYRGSLSHLIDLADFGVQSKCSAKVRVCTWHRCFSMLLEHLLC